MECRENLRLVIITESAMEKTHGTGAQLLRLFDKREHISYNHFFFYEGVFGQSTRANSFFIGDKELRFRRGAGFLTRLRKNLGLSWWNTNGKVNKQWFQRLVRENNIQCDLAYVVIADESHTPYALSLLEQFPVPYVVHLMDLYSESGIDPKRDPGFNKLLTNASCVIALTETIHEEVCKFGIPHKSVPVVPIGQEVTPYTAKPPESDQPIKIVMVGRPYDIGCQLLLDTHPLLVDRNRAPVEIYYAGSHFSLLPPGLQAITHNVGQISDPDKYSQFLAGCHIAYLSGPNNLDCFGRFSFPSRSSDYLMAGLPMISAVASGSASERTLLPLVPDAVKLVKDPIEIRSSIDDLVSSRESWEKASRMSREFAVAHLNISRVQEKIDSILTESLCR